MTPTDPQADRLRDALHSRVDSMYDAPLSLEAVQGRAGRIRRNRRLAVAGGVAAVVAIVTPLAFVAQGSLAADPEPVPPAATQPADDDATPDSVGEREFTTRGLPDGAATDVPWIDTRADRVIAGDLVVDSIEMPQDAVRWDGGLLVTGDAGDSRLFVLDEDGDLVGEPVELPAARTLVAAPSLGLIAWVQESDDGGQALVLASDDDPTDEAARTVVRLPDLGGFEPVGIGPDGVVLNATYPDRAPGVVVARRDGTLREVANLRQAVGVDPATGDIAGTTGGNRPCGVLASMAGYSLRKIDCGEWIYRAMSPDGRWIVATTIGADGFGDPSMMVLNAETGELQAGWSSRSNPPVTWLQGYQWEDGDTLVANVEQGTEQALVRFGLDGSTELASEPVEVEPFTDHVVVLPD